MRKTEQEAEQQDQCLRAPFCYRCECGFVCYLRKDFADHIITTHEDKTITNSSQNISPYLNETSRIDSYKIEFAEELNFVNSVQPKIQQVLVSQSVLNQQKNNEEIHISELLKTKWTSCQWRQDIYFNGWRLVRNQECYMDLYYCGKCGLTLHTIINYIRHSVAVCRTLDHPQSSHFLYLQDTEPDNYSKQKEKQKKKSLKKQKKPEKVEDSKQKQRNLVKWCQGQLILTGTSYKKGRPSRYPRGIIFQVNKFKKERSVHIVCGFCKESFEKVRLYVFHLRNMHEETCSPQSSHLIMQYLTGKNPRQITPYPIEINPKQEKNQLVYSCPCSQLYMNRKKFIDHMLTQHKGISPQYQ